MRTTQEILEEKLRSVGKLKPDEHLTPAEVTKLIDFIRNETSTHVDKTRATQPQNFYTASGECIPGEKVEAYFERMAKMQQDAQNPSLATLHAKTRSPKKSHLWHQCTEEISDDQLYRALEKNDVTTITSKSGLEYVVLEMPTPSTPQPK